MDIPLEGPPFKHHTVHSFTSSPAQQLILSPNIPRNHGKDRDKLESLPSGVYSLERGTKQMLVELDEKIVSAMGNVQRNTIGWELNKVRDTSAQVRSISWRT